MTSIDRAELLTNLGAMPEYLDSQFGQLSHEDATRPGPDNGFSPVEQCWHLVDLNGPQPQDQHRRAALEARRLARVPRRGAAPRREVPARPDRSPHAHRLGHQLRAPEAGVRGDGRAGARARRRRARDLRRRRAADSVPRRRRSPSTPRRCTRCGMPRAAGSRRW